MAVEESIRHCRDCGVKECALCKDDPSEHIQHRNKCCVHCGRTFKTPCKVCRPNSWLLKKQKEEYTESQNVHSVAYLGAFSAAALACLYSLLDGNIITFLLSLYTLVMGMRLGKAISESRKVRLYYPPEDRYLGIDISFRGAPYWNYIGLRGMETLLNEIKTGSRSAQAGEEGFSGHSPYVSIGEEEVLEHRHSLGVDQETVAYIRTLLPKRFNGGDDVQTAEDIIREAAESLSR